MNSVDEVKEEYGRFIMDQDLVDCNTLDSDANNVHTEFYDVHGDGNISKLRDIRNDFRTPSAKKRSKTMPLDNDCSPFAQDDEMFEDMRSLTLGRNPVGDVKSRINYRRASDMLRNQLSTPKCTPTGDPKRKNRRKTKITHGSPVYNESDSQVDINTDTPQVNLSKSQSPTIRWADKRTPQTLSPLCSTSPSCSSSTSLRSTESKESTLPALPRAKFTKVTITEPKNFRKDLEAKNKERLAMPSLSTNSTPTSLTNKYRLGEFSNLDVKKRLFGAQLSPIVSQPVLRTTSLPTYTKRPRTALDQMKSMKRLSSGLSTMPGIMKVGDYASTPKSISAAKHNRQRCWSEPKVKIAQGSKFRPKTAAPLARLSDVKTPADAKQDPSELLHNMEFVCDHVKEMQIRRNI